jgi:hypothetical protein
MKTYFDHLDVNLMKTSSKASKLLFRRETHQSRKRFPHDAATFIQVSLQLRHQNSSPPTTLPPLVIHSLKAFPVVSPNAKTIQCPIFSADASKRRKECARQPR